MIGSEKPAERIKAQAQGENQTGIAVGTEQFQGDFGVFEVDLVDLPAQMQAKAQTIIAAQRSRGLDTEGTFLKRVGSLLPLVSPLVFGSLVEVEERAIAIEARGFTSTRPKTFLREIKDSKFDKILRWFMIFAILFTILAAKLWR